MERDSPGRVRTTRLSPKVSPDRARLNLTEQPHHSPPRIRVHRQEVDEVGPLLTFRSEAATVVVVPLHAHTDKDRYRRIFPHRVTDGWPRPHHLPWWAHSR
jgi:hypothetical protein